MKLAVVDQDRFDLYKVKAVTALEVLDGITFNQIILKQF